MVRWSLKSRLVTITVALFAVLMVLLILVARHYAYIGLTRLLQEQQDNQVALIATQLDDKLELRARMLEALAVHIAPAGDHEPLQIDSIARNASVVPSTFDWLMLISPQGKPVFDTRKNIVEPVLNYADRKYFLQVTGGASFAISDPLLGRVSGRPILMIAVPVRRADGRLVGVLAGGLDLQSKNFLNELSNARPVQSGVFCLVTQGPHPVYVMHPDASRLLDAVGDGAGTCGSAVRQRLWFFGPLLDPIVSRHRLAATNWELIENLAPTEAYSPFTSTRPRLIAGVLIGLVAGALLMYLVIRRLLIPVQQLHRVVLRSASDPAAYKALAMNQSGEVADLAIAFASLMQQLTLKSEGLREAGKLADERQQLIESIANRIPDLVAYLDLDARYLFANRSYETHFGFKVSQLLGRSVREVWGESVYLNHVASHFALACTGETSTFDYLWDGPRGRQCFEVTYQPVRDVDNEVVGVHVFSRNVTEEREEMRRLEQTTLLDHLTGLLNRKGFDRRLAAAFEQARDGLKPVALLLVDLDDFKDVNDTYGHACGDQLLARVADRLECCVGALDAVARIGGDEFAVVLETEVTHESVERTSRKIVEALTAPYDIERREIRCAASVGAAIHLAADDSSINELFMRADTALYAAKHAGKGQFTMFDHAAARVT